MCKFGILLSYLIMLPNIHTSTSVSLDLSELRNKVTKNKVNPRGNLWATGHFMGKKSISDHQVFGFPPFDHVRIRRVQTPREPDEVLKELMTEGLLKTFQIQLKDPPDSLKQETDVVVKLFNMAKRKR